MLDLTDGIKDYGNIIEGFTRDGEHTSNRNMWLVERSAPTPPEKVIKENIPFMQGTHDFSMILGGRVYENRPLTYRFEIINQNYQNRKVIQTSLENWLMRSGYEPLYDDHAKGYYYIAKCTSVDVADSSGGLTVVIEFDAYPFKIGELQEGNDIWDTFNFELDVAQITKFEVNGSEEIVLYNVGQNNLVPTIKTSVPMEIIKDGVTYVIPTGDTKSHEIAIGLGENHMTIKGNGTIEFLFYKELI